MIEMTNKIMAKIMIQLMMMMMPVLLLEMLLDVESSHAEEARPATFNPN